MSRRPAPDLDFKTFKAWAKEAFEGASKELEFPFETPFGMDVHFVGEDDQFTLKVNETLPILGPKIQAEGIKIPKGDIGVVSVVRKAKAYDEGITNTPIWTFDRVREVPKNHLIIRNITTWVNAPDHESMESVKQWFVIARFQADADIRPPILVMTFGYIDFSDEYVMGGLCPISPDAQKALRISDKEMLEMQYQFAYECSESLRQVAALAYLEETK